MAVLNYNVGNSNNDVIIINANTDFVDVVLDPSTIDNCSRNRIYVKRLDSTVNPVQVQTAVGNIDGLANYPLAPLQCVLLFWNQTLNQWNVLLNAN